MQKRTVKIGEYNTADYGWTLTGCAITAPEQKTNYVDRPGGDGNIDLSTVLTGGIPRYKDRTLTITLENSQGDREHRERLINKMVNQLDGLVWPIVHPDRPDYYLAGRVHVQVDYSDPAHAMVTLTAQCEPWFYRARETVVSVAIGTEGLETEVLHLLNDGRKVVSPTITVDGSVTLLVRDDPNSDLSTVTTYQLTTGTHVLPSVLLYPGRTRYELQGTGSVVFTYREAVLR